MGSNGLGAKLRLEYLEPQDLPQGSSLLDVTEEY